MLSFFKKKNTSLEISVSAKPIEPKNSEILPPPYGPTIQSITNSGIVVYWKKPQGVSGYEIYRSYESGKIGELAKVITNPILGVWSDTEFRRDVKTIYYHVRCYLDKADGEKTFSEFTEEFTANYRESLILERDVTIIHSDSSRLLKAFYGWGEVSDAVWASTDESVATVDPDGTINGISKGECKVSCSSASLGMSASSDVIIDRSAPEPLCKIVSRYEYNAETGFWENDTPRAENDAVIMMTGDMMCGLGQINKQYTESEGWNFNDSFDYLREVTSESDFTVANLETLLDPAWPYMSDEWFINNISNCNAPPRYLDAVRYGGFDGVIMSNNHSCDGGVLSLKATLDQVQRYKLAATGAFRDSSEKRFFIADINGIKVGFVAYMSLDTGYNGKDRRWSKTDKEIMLNNFSREKAEKDITECRKAGAEFVIAYMHWGQKNYRIPTPIQEQEALDIAEAGADYIVGSNPHVLERYDVISTSGGRNIPCFYSVGNFQARMNQVTGNRDSVMVRLHLIKEDGIVSIADNSYIPFFTYTNIGGSYLAPVSVSSKYHDKLIRKGRRTKEKRIAEAIGNKISKY